MAYRQGDLGVTYPRPPEAPRRCWWPPARRTLAGERLDAWTLVGIALVCAGIIGLAREGRGTAGCSQGHRPRRPDRV